MMKCLEVPLMAIVLRKLIAFLHMKIVTTKDWQYLGPFAYYVLAISYSLIGGFVLDYKVVGLWGGMIVGIAALSLLQGVTVVTADWEWVVSMARMRNQV